MDYTRLFLIRHGQVVGHEQLRFNGHTDVDLTPTGRSQMEAAAEDLAHVDLAAVYSSDLKRARYGGEALAQKRSLELRIEPAFRELHFGQWEGLNFEQIETRFPGQLEARRKFLEDYRPPGAETIGEFWDRVTSRLAILLEEHQGQHVALIAHSGVNRAIILQALGGRPEHLFRLHQDFGCLNIIDYFNGSWPVVKLANQPNRLG